MHQRKPRKWGFLGMQGNPEIPFLSPPDVIRVARKLCEYVTGPSFRPLGPVSMHKLRWDLTGKHERTILAYGKTIREMKTVHYNFGLF